MNMKIYMSMYTILLLFPVLNLAKGIQHIIKHADPSDLATPQEIREKPKLYFVCLFVLPRENIEVQNRYCKLKTWKGN